MVERVRYMPNRREMRRLMQSADMARLCEQAAQNAKSYAEGLAPRDSGEYARGFRVETRIVGDRQTAVVRNDTPYAALLEVKHRILGRAADHAKP